MDLSPAKPLRPCHEPLSCGWRQHRRARRLQRRRTRRLMMRTAISRTKAMLAGVCAAIALAACSPPSDTAVAQQPSESPADRKHAVPSLIAERSEVTPGDVFLGALKLDLEDTWHVYWRNPGDSGLKPEVQWTLPEGIKTGDFKWPAPHAIRLATLMNYGYEHQLILPFEVTVPA